MPIKLSVIVPNYNEAVNLERGVLAEIDSYLSEQSWTSEVIVSDDGSTDASLKFIDDFTKSHPRFTVLRNRHAGKPYALRSAIKQAKGEYILLTDMDQSTPIVELNKLLPWTDKGYNVAIGSRGARRADSTPFRKLASIVFLLIRRSILLSEIKDTQCGFKLIETELARSIFDRMRLFGRANNAVGWKVTAYDVELLHLAKKMGAKIKEVRVIWKNEDKTMGKSGNFVLSFVKESLEMLFEIMRVRVNDMLGKYD